MSDPALALQGAVVAALKADAAVTALAGDRVYDRVPGPDTAFPYVSLGPCDVVQNDATCIGGADVTLQIDVWSREPGFREAKALAGAVRTALHLLETSFDGLSFEIEHRTTRHFRDPDGLTSHAAVEVTALIDTGNA